MQNQFQLRLGHGHLKKQNLFYQSQRPHVLNISSAIILSVSNGTIDNVTITIVNCFAVPAITLFRHQ